MAVVEGAPAPSSAPRVTCPRGRAPCEVRGTLCAMCSAEVQADVARLKSAAPAAVPDGRTGLATLSGEQVFFTLRVKLLAGCRAGVPFTTAWEYSTALLLEQLAPREAKGWATVFDATRSEWSAAYRAHSRRPK